MPRKSSSPDDFTTHLAHTPLWELGITELAGHNIESIGREEVNSMLKKGWIVLHIYTLKYHEDGVWRERPMVILGKPRKVRSHVGRIKERPLRPRTLH